MAVAGVIATSAPAVAASDCSFSGQSTVNGVTVITGVVAGTTAVTATCTSAENGDAFIQASPLAGIVTAPGMASNDVDLGTLHFVASGTAGPLTIPSPFAAGDTNAVCPPTQAQENAGLVGCAVTVANITTQVQAGTAILLYSSGQLAPQNPTLALSPTTAKAGDTITVTGSGWWGDGLASTTIPAANISVGGVTVTTGSLSVSAATYNGTTLTAPQISGTFTVPAGVASGAQTVKVDEHNSTPLAGNGPGNTVEGTASLTIGSSVTPVSITTTSPLPTGSVGVPYSTSLAATGGTTPYTWSVSSGALPAGITLNTSTGALSGTPTAGVLTGSVTFKVTDSTTPTAQTATKTFLITITPSTSAPSITTTSLPNGTVGTPYSASLAATGGTTPYTWSVSSGTLPAGITLNTSTGALSGTPSAAVSNDMVTFKVTDSTTPTAQTATKALSITISPATSAVTITTTALPNGTVGTPYSATLAATGGTTPYTWSVSSGTLPAGLTLNTSTGAITGTPTTAVSADSVTFKVTDSTTPTPQTATKALSITIAPVSVGGPVVSGLSVHQGTAGTPVTITGTGFSGVAPLAARVLSTTPTPPIVDFGPNNPSSSVTCTSDTTCTAIAPPHAPGTVDVTVTVGNNTSATSSADQFTYLGGGHCTLKDIVVTLKEGDVKVHLDGDDVSVHHGHIRIRINEDDLSVHVPQDQISFVNCTPPKNAKVHVDSDDIKVHLDSDDVTVGPHGHIIVNPGLDDLSVRVTHDDVHLGGGGD